MASSAYISKAKCKSYTKETLHSRPKTDHHKEVEKGKDVPVL
jgi:hypothetical protein